MPIKRLLESRGRLPRLGVIRLGVKEKKDGKEYPRETEFFVVPDTLKPTVGEYPKKLSVLFPSDDPHRILTADYIRYSGKLLSLKCDGERYTEIPRQGGEIVGDCKKATGKPCACGAKAVGRLNVILLDAPLGVWQIIVGGEGRIADLFMELEVYRRALGRLTDIVFVVERVPTEMQVKKEDGSRLARTGHPVHVRCEFTAAQAASLRGGALLGLLPALPGVVEEHEDEPTPETPEEEPPIEEYDISWCYAAARRAGIDPPDYETYLRAVYKTEPGDLPNAAITDEVVLWHRAEENTTAQNTMRSMVQAVLKKAERQRALL